ncbi:response regulator [Glutamicibacter soli]|uniref:response regulator n=1 Tax=Micrococcaceae TaxID=1268 RepID=UPI001C7CA851
MTGSGLCSSGLAVTSLSWFSIGGLPIIEGLDILERLRRKGISSPALILSALSNPADRVEGLDRGAEDYLGKPPHLRTPARLRARTRRRARNR